MKQQYSICEALSSDQKMRRVLALLFAVLVLLPTTKTQSQSQSAEVNRSGMPNGSITGHVITDDGQPLINAWVFLGTLGASGSGGVGRNLMTDEDGNFKVDGLRPGAYSLSSSAPGYFAESFLHGEVTRVFYHPGDAVTLTLIKGSVITGRVTNALGEPTAGLNVSASRLRNSEGDATSINFSGMPAYTDDRGVYRIYGLPPGAYLVFTRSEMGRSDSAFDGDAATYYPSATRDAATEITLHQSEEISGIDLQYRGERGHTISGTIAGANPADRSGVSLTLTHAGAIAGSAYWSPQNGVRGWALKGLADGEYEITALRYSNDSPGAASLPRRVMVRGTDVTGLELTLTPLAAISGKVLLESASADPSHKACENKRLVFLEETVLQLQRDEAESRNEAAPLGSMLSSMLTRFLTSDSKGEYEARNLKPGRYRLTAQMPNENIYLRAITLSGSARPRGAASTAQSAADNVARYGVTLKSGERATGLTVILTEGAAGVKGKVIATEGTTLPPRSPSIHSS